eukprot:Filipodium_phascolosomae@DN6431_c0_g1_i1.p1
MDSPVCIMEKDLESRDSVEDIVIFVDCMSSSSSSVIVESEILSRFGIGIESCLLCAANGHDLLEDTAHLQILETGQSKYFLLGGQISEECLDNPSMIFITVVVVIVAFSVCTMSLKNFIYGSMVATMVTYLLIT